MEEDAAVFTYRWACMFIMVASRNFGLHIHLDQQLRHFDAAVLMVGAHTQTQYEEADPVAIVSAEILLSYEIHT